MELAVLLGALAVIGVVAAVASGKVRGGLDEPTTSRPYHPLPDRPMDARDVDDVRFSMALRGYRMDEVDEVLGRLRDEIADRDAELGRLRPPPGPAPADVAPAEGPDAASAPAASGETGDVHDAAGR